jgi:hypothetical protein
MYVIFYDDQCCGLLLTLTNDKNVEHVHDVVGSDRGKCIQDMSAEVVISVVNVHSIRYKDLNIHCPCQHLVPKVLTPEQKEK